MGKLQNSGVCPFPKSLGSLVCRALCDICAWQRLLEAQGSALVLEQRFPSEQPRSFVRQGEKPALLSHPQVNEGHCHPVTP